MSKLVFFKKSNLNIILPIVAIGVISCIAMFQFIDRGGLNKIDGVADSCGSRAFSEIGGPFDLVDQDSKPFSDRNLLGKPALIYFGYTYCPDVCPTSLTYMGASMEALEQINPALRKDINNVFITIDPDRDTPSQMKEYVKSGGFPEGLIGLSGSQDAVKKAAREYKVGFKKVIPPNADAKDYVMDHTSIIYMINREGKLATFFSDRTNPTEIAKCVAKLDKSDLDKRNKDKK